MKSFFGLLRWLEPDTSFRMGLEGIPSLIRYIGINTLASSAFQVYGSKGFKLQSPDNKGVTGW
jgi:hypothetical protein